MTERDRRIAELKARIDLAQKEKEVRGKIAVSGGFTLVSAGLAFANPAFIGSTLVL